MLSVINVLIVFLYLVAGLASADVRRWTAWLFSGGSAAVGDTPGGESSEKILYGGAVV